MKEKIEKVKLEIDKIIEKVKEEGYLSIDNMNCSGGGRNVAIIDGFAVKFPKVLKYNTWCDGHTQNLNELKVYLSCKHERLVPIIDVHSGCLICKKVKPMLELIDGRKISTSRAWDIIEEGMEELQGIIKEYDLDEDDMDELRNWGLDEEDGMFKCLDYGIAMHE